MHKLFLFGGYIKKGNRQRVGGESKGFLLGKKQDESMGCSSMGERKDRKRSIGKRKG